MTLAETWVRESCPCCNGGCSNCRDGYVYRHAYAPGKGEQSDNRDGFELAVFAGDVVDRQAYARAAAADPLAEAGHG